VLRREAFYTDRDVQWFDPTGRTPDWLDPNQRRLACLVRGVDGPDLYLMFNADTQPASFILPGLSDTRRWQLAIDTAQPSWDVDPSERDGHGVTGPQYALGARASAVLVATSLDA
jgi:pullulanase/glycogen debranching enzyme